MNTPQHTQIEYSTRGGLRWGKTYWRSSNVTVPFARMRASAQELTIRVSAMIVHVELRVQRAEVIRVEHQRGLFTPGVRIIHSNENIPPFVLFWTYLRADVMKNLTLLGYCTTHDAE